MRNFEAKKTWRRILESRPALIVLGIIALVFAWNVLRLAGKMLETAKNKKMAEERVLHLEEQKAKLEKDIQNLNTLDGKERIFRENFGLTKEGEEVIIIIDDKRALKAEALEAKKGFWQGLMFWKKDREE
jgi:hypothetical protein